MSTKAARPRTTSASSRSTTSLTNSSTKSKSSKKARPKKPQKTNQKKAAPKKSEHEPFDWINLVPSPVIGVDEVGRGCLAGPVFAAAVILPCDFSIEGVTDSKLLSEIRREELSALIFDCAQVGLGFATVGEIDRLNILNATFTAMRRAIENLFGSLSAPIVSQPTLGLRARGFDELEGHDGFGGATPGGHVLVDGNMKIRLLDEIYHQTPLVKGDLRATPIAAASIVAKVARDQFMKKLALDYPLYGFEKHKGYGSSLHTAAIQTHGPCVHHRATFAGVREHWTVELDEERSRDSF